MTLLDAARTFPSIFDESAAAVTPTDRDRTDDDQTVAAPPAVEARPADAVAAPGFDALGVPSPLVRALHRENISTPFPIQQATIPDALAGRDVLGRGQTGSGKTLAFGLPMLARIAASGRSAPHRPKGLILVPTRELAMQVNDALTPLAKSLGLFTKTAFGGSPYSTQIYALERGVDVLVATPGRLGDLIEKGICSLDAVEVTVLDEADQMADMGFLPEVTALLGQTPAGGQRLLFSATLDGDVDTLVHTFLSDPVTHEVDAAVATVDTMSHHALLIPPRDKFPILAAIANRRGRTIMFVKTQMAVDRLVEQLGEVGVRAGSLHGGKTQRVRTRTLAEFKEGRIDTLIATNVAARGIHVDGVDLVVHVDPPADSKDYLHRAGRTARAGESGMVVTLVLPRQRRSTFSMLERAGVTAGRTEVTVEGAALGDLTGARTPSGVPVPPLPEPTFGRRGRPDDGSPRRGRPGSRDFGSRDSGARSFSSRDSGARAYGQRDQGARPYTRREDTPRSYSERDAGSRSYGQRDTGARTYGQRDTGTRGFGQRDQDQRPYAKRDDAPRTSAAPQTDSGREHARRFEDRRAGRPDSRERRPGASRDEARPAGHGRPYPARGDRPYAPRTERTDRRGHVRPTTGH